MRFSTIRTIMTLDDRVQVSPAQIKSLRTLLAAVTGLPLDYPDDSEWPIHPRFEDLVHKSSAKVPLVYPACGCYFDIAPGRKYPNAKIQVPLYVYGQEEGKLARGVAQWMRENGRGKFADAFLEALPHLGDRRTAHSEDGAEGHNGYANGTYEDMPRGLQSYLSVMFTESGELEVTTYLVPVFSGAPWVV